MALVSEWRFTRKHWIHNRLSEKCENVFLSVAQVAKSTSTQGMFRQNGQRWQKRSQNDDTFCNEPFSNHQRTITLQTRQWKAVNSLFCERNWFSKLPNQQKHGCKGLRSIWSMIGEESVSFFSRTVSVNFVPSVWVKIILSWKGLVCVTKRKLENLNFSRNQNLIMGFYTVHSLKKLFLFTEL